MSNTLSLNELTRQVGTWGDYNFRHDDADDDAVATTLGLMEEAGEVARAVLKRHQNIRGSRGQWEDEARKEIGDVTIKLADVCWKLGLDFEKAVVDRWDTISRRDFRADRIGHGMPEDADA